MSPAPSEPSHLKILELSELAGGLAHEIRNPLSTLKVNMQLLQEDLRELPEGACIDGGFRHRTLKRLDTLRGETERLQELLDRFVRLVSAQDIERRMTDLRGVVSEVAEFFQAEARQHGIVVRLEEHAAPLPCHLDASRIKQAVLNLVVNARQAMSEGGELLLATRREGDTACIDVVDTGAGIESDIQSRIFAPFFSTKKDGSGLGLSLTRRIVHEHGGTLDVESTVGRGTRFTVALPLETRSDPVA